jgi:cellulase/cellobiase CelA1
LAGSWPGGFQGEVTVTNSSAVALNGWTVQWTFPSGQTITNLWAGTLASPGPVVMVKSLSWNGGLRPGTSAIFGFNGSAPAGNVAPTFTCQSP